MKDDPEYGSAVQQLRVRECTLDDVDLFNSRVVKSAANPSGIDMSLERNYEAAAIVATNKATNVFTCLALDKCSQKQLSLEECQILLDLDVASTQQSLPSAVLLFEGMPVILRVRNVSTDLGITNGSQGFVHKIFTETCPQS